MAAAAISAIARLLGAPGLIGSLERGALIGIGSLGAQELISAIQSDLAPSAPPEAKATAKRVPQYAIVDLHTNKVVRFMSAKHVYTILTHRRRINRTPRKPTIITSPAGSTITLVK